MEDSTAVPSHGNEIKNQSLRVALLSETGIMQTLWLPAKLEGRYRFGKKNGIDDTSFLLFEPVNDAWSARCVDTGYFRTGGKYLGNTARLDDQSLTEVYYQNRKYVLYVESENEESNVFHSYYVEKFSDIYIGRSPDCDICYPNRLVSRNHAVLFWAGDHWRIRDENSSNGVYLNGREIQEERVKIGDVIFIVGLRIIMGAGFISLNDGNERINITTPRLRRIEREKDVDIDRTPIKERQNGLFKRKPRRKIPLPVEPIEVELPPMPMAGNNIPLLLRIGSPMVMGGRALMMGNVAMMLTSMLFPVLTNGYSEKEKKEYEAKRQTKYREYLKGKEAEILQERDRERDVLARQFPDFSGVLAMLNSKDRLWERRKIDDDFLKLRLGNGRIPLLAELEYQPRKLEIEPDVLEDEMYALVEKPVYLDDAPILLSLKDDWLVAVNGERRVRNRFLQMLLTRLVVLHSYDEVKLVILADELDAEDLVDFRFLPHCWNDEMDMRFVASNKSDAIMIGEYLRKLVEEDGDRPEELDEILKRRPHYVVVATDKGLFDTIEFFKQLRVKSTNCGFSIITAFDGSPIECTKLIEIKDESSAVMTDLVDAEKQDQRFSLDYLNTQHQSDILRLLSHIRQKNVTRAYSLPKTVTFLEMFGAGRVEHLNPLKRWAENNPVKSLSAPIGIGTDGGLMYLDLHEKYQGPHGLVAGTTGSGKSEFIITYILSMAVNYNPDEVAFILIDYKGGGLTGAFEDERRGIHLPHLVGTITNLDGAAIQRSLMSINSELKRRQALFNEAKSRNNEGTMDIYSYQKLYREKKVDEPLPHLFIISDEFAELKQQQPEFMDELISTARIGRSLGVHLILATQKPAGVVNEQIWSNTKFRVCLKVQDKADSNDMLKRPEAAELKDTGRFYLQVGYNEYFALGQSAWSGADYEPRDEVVETVDHSVQFLDSTGQTVAQIRPEIKKEKSGSKQIVAVVQYLSDLAKREHIKARKLWIDPLPKSIELDEVHDRYFEKPKEGVKTVIGMVDDPQHQSQFPLWLDVQGSRNFALIGDSGSGKTSFLRSMLFSIVRDYTPQEVTYYILDYSGGGLAPLRYAPHCGAYLTEKDENDVDRLLDMLRSVVEERKKLFTDAGVSNFDAYSHVASIPLMLLVIDNFAGLTALPKGTDYHSNIHKFFRDALPYGIISFVSSSHFNELSSRSKQEIQDRIGLHVKDKYEYFELTNVKADFMPPDLPGRGLCAIDGRMLEYQTAQFGASLDDQVRSIQLKARIEEISREKGYRQTERVLPMMDPEQRYEDFCAGFTPGRIPLGYSADVRAVSMPLQQMYRTSLYFGNNTGIAPVLRNFLCAADMNGMKVLVLKKSAESRFAGRNALTCRDLETIECDEKGTNELLIRMNQEILSRKVYRNQFCEENGLTLQTGNLMRRAAPFIREHTQPLMILIESFADFCKAASDACLQNFPILFEQAMGFNFYFVGCFYHEDGDKMQIEALAQSFNKDPFALFFGGQLNKQGVTMLPAQYIARKKIDPEYNKALMLYQGDYHEILMPCGVLEKDDTDPDERAII